MRMSEGSSPNETDHVNKTDLDQKDPPKVRTSRQGLDGALFDSLEEARMRFDAACTAVITLAPRERHGIGMQSEKTLHAVLKNYIDPDEDHQEIPIDNYVADIYHDGRITEIQTAHMDAMRARLRCFLPQYPVRIVYPVPAEKWIIWVDPDTGELLKKTALP